MASIYRRRVLLATPALLLTRCALPSGPVIPLTIITEAKAVVGGVAGAVGKISAAGCAPSTMQANIAAAQTAASSLTPSMQAASGAGVVMVINGCINAVLNICAAPPINGLIPSPFNTVVAAAAYVMPDLEAFVDHWILRVSLSPAVHEVRAKLIAAAPVAITTTEQAMAILQEYSQS
jgi:hypothetical protein